MHHNDSHKSIIKKIISYLANYSFNGAILGLIYAVSGIAIEVGVDISVAASNNATIHVLELAKHALPIIGYFILGGFAFGFLCGAGHSVYHYIDEYYCNNNEINDMHNPFRRIFTIVSIPAIKILMPLGLRCELLIAPFSNGKTNFSEKLNSTSFNELLHTVHGRRSGRNRSHISVDESDEARIDSPICVVIHPDPAPVGSSSPHQSLTLPPNPRPVMVIPPRIDVSLGQGQQPKPPANYGATLTTIRN